MLYEVITGVVCPAMAGVRHALRDAVASSELTNGSETLERLATEHEQWARDLGVDAPGSLRRVWDDALRLMEGARLTGEVPVRARRRIIAAGAASVITSYSIHYTKLYDTGWNGLG